VFKIWSTLLTLNLVVNCRSWIFVNTYRELVLTMISSLMGDVVSAGLMSLVMTLILLIYSLVRPLWNRVGPDRIQ
jgi:hypothetical protein